MIPSVLLSVTASKLTVLGDVGDSPKHDRTASFQDIIISHHFSSCSNNSHHS